MTASPALRLFEAVGIEIEYAIVDADTLDVRPIADLALKRAAGADEFVADVDDGDIAWSNELAAHVLEFKTNGPAPSCAGLAHAFQESIDRLSVVLDNWDALLLPTGMHPWMVPKRETKLWSHAGSEIYRAYDKIFDCRRHGWANVQSVHLNLPFGDEAEYARLAAAARLILPALPALSASSPFVEGLATGLLDTRLDFYKDHAARVPAMVGGVIPEPIWDFAGYRSEILDPIARAVREVDADGALGGNEWLNARGAIVRQDRMALEIRLLDTQECALADIALCALVTAAVRRLTEEGWSTLAEQRAAATEPLSALLLGAIATGPETPIERGYGAFFGHPEAATLGELWNELWAEVAEYVPAELEAPIAIVLEQGPLAARLLRAVGTEPSREDLLAVYGELAGCLAHGRLFEGP